MKKSTEQIKIEQLEKQLQEIKQSQAVSQIKYPKTKLVDRPGLVFASLAIVLFVLYFGQSLYANATQKKEKDPVQYGTSQTNNQQTSAPPKTNQPQVPASNQQSQTQTQQPQRSTLNLQPVPQIQAPKVDVTPAYDANAYQKKLDSLSPTPTYTTNCFYTPEGTYFCSTH